jgi:hypothetical protein
MANWYIYTGVGDPTLSTSYRLSTIKPTCTGTGGQICAIYLNETDPVPPSINPVITYIANALGALSSQPTGAVKRFVYVKCSCP